MTHSTCRLRTESVEATFRVSPHLLGVSLRHGDVELLRQIDTIERSEQLGHPCGIPLLHPWANRLETHAYTAAGKQVVLDTHAPLLGRDAEGLPLHGVPWSSLRAVLEACDEQSFTARLDWDGELLEIFPFRHSLRIRASVLGSALTITTELHATGRDHVPVSFGFHPYFGFSGMPRDAWRLGLPARMTLALDARGIPTGESQFVAASNNALGTAFYDDALALTQASAECSISDDTRRIRVQCVKGYTHVQVYAPSDQAFVCIEPMTAPVNALCSGHGVRLVAPGERFSAIFRILVENVS